MDTPTVFGVIYLPYTIETSAVGVYVHLLDGICDAESWPATTIPSHNEESTMTYPRLSDTAAN